MRILFSSKSSILRRSHHDFNVDFRHTFYISSPMRVKTKHYSGVTSAMVRGSIEINSTLRQRRKCILLDNSSFRNSHETHVSIFTTPRKFFLLILSKAIDPKLNEDFTQSTSTWKQRLVIMLALFHMNTKCTVFWDGACIDVLGMNLSNCSDSNLDGHMLCSDEMNLFADLQVKAEGGCSPRRNSKRQIIRCFRLAVDLGRN